MKNFILERLVRMVMVALPTFFSFFLLNLKAQPIPPVGKEWQVNAALTDEFDTFDGTKWYKLLWNYPEPVSMQSKNSGVTDGKLWIKATLGPDAARWFETCRISSKAQIKFPMYTECRMKTAHISAFNTYWLNNGNSANRDEIDICENVSNPSNPPSSAYPYTLNSQYFIVKNSVTERNKGNFDNRNLSASNPMKGVKWNNWHTLGMWWKDKNNIQFYINGEPAGKVITKQDFTLSQSIIWDLWTSPESWFPGIANKSDLLNDSINTMYVDWIHTYNLVDKTTNVGEVSVENGIKLYPNPVTDILNIELSDLVNDTAILKIYSSSGSVVQIKKLKNRHSNVSLKSLSAGNYIAKVYNGESTSITTIIKQ